MELKVGMYVRNENGISKYLGLGKDVLTNDESNQFKHYANQHLFDRNIFDVGHDWGDTLSDEEFKNIDKYIEKEPSYDVIDLIEIGDYVNGLRINSITEVDENHDVRLVWNLTTYGLRINSITEVDENHDVRLVRNLTTYGDNDISFSNEEIKSIVTKEQFESVKYEVE